MTIIDQDGGNFWIETFVVARAAIGAGITDTELTLERPGLFLGCSIALDTAETEVVMNRCHTSLQVGSTDNSLTYGLEIGSIRLRRSNTSGTVTFGAYVLVFMRKKGLPI